MKIGIMLKAIALGAIVIGAPGAARADIVPPPVPGDIAAPEGARAFLIGHAVGTQNYVCLPSANSPSGFAWILHGPQATLFNTANMQIVTHFLSPNPWEPGQLRATWQHSNDSSTVWAVMIKQSSDSAYVAPGAIPWFLLEVRGAQLGPAGGHKLARTTHIQRVNTYGGAAPATGCSAAGNIGARAIVPYEADYVFFKSADDIEN